MRDASCYYDRIAPCRGRRGAVGGCPSVLRNRTSQSKTGLSRSESQTNRLDFGGGVGMSAARGGRRLSLGLVEERVESIR